MNSKKNNCCLKCSLLSAVVLCVVLFTIIISMTYKPCECPLSQPEINEHENEDIDELEKSKTEIEMVKFDKTVCFLKKDVGPCRASIMRFAFNQNLNQCEEFIYGGCGGNKNNFENEEDCSNTCLEPEINGHENEDIEELEKSKTEIEMVKLDKTVCFLKKDVGPCRASIMRFAFNQSINQCEEFIYGGCGGNKNNFENEEDCSKTCLGLTNNNCHLAADTGPCLSLIPRFAYDYKIKACKQFIYGGCQGNGNNFKTLELCEAACLVFIE